MFLTLHLSWQALPTLLVQLRARQACQKTQASTQIYVYPIPRPLETLLWGLWGFPPPVQANERNTCSIIIYRIFCLFIILFFQKENVNSGPILYNLWAVLNSSFGRIRAYYTRRRELFEKWALSCEADIYMIVSKCWKPPEPVIIIIHRILWGGLGHGQWAVSLDETSTTEQFPFPVKKTLIVFTVHVWQDIFKIYYTWTLFLVFNHLSSLSCNLYWSDYWVNIAVTQGVYK